VDNVDKSENLWGIKVLPVSNLWINLWRFFMGYPQIPQASTFSTGEAYLSTLYPQGIPQKFALRLYPVDRSCGILVEFLWIECG
jgi:hypothetical protein